MNKTIFNNQDLELLLNYYLENIKKYNYKQIKLFNLKNYINYDKIIVDEANIIADDLIQKLFSINNRYIKLPVNIDILTEYSISSLIKKKDLNKVVYLIILKLAIVNYNLTYY